MKPPTTLAVLSLLALCACGRSAPAPVTAPPPPAPAAASAPAPSAPLTKVEAAGHTRAPTPEEDAWVRQLSREAARLRGLSFLRPVRVEIRDAAAMKQFVHEQLEDEPLDLIRRRYALLGLLDPELDIWDVYLEVMEEQLMGYYDPEQGALTIRQDVARKLARAHRAGDVMDEITLAGIVFHELIHALQDQHFDLSQLESDELSNDAVMALQALVEGDATVATFAYYAERTGTPFETLFDMGMSSMREPAGSGAVADSKLAGAPPILRETLLFPYREGAMFVNELLRTGDWAMVDAAHRSLPPSTGHILWPDRQLRGELLSPLPPDAPDTLVDASVDVEVLEDEVLGPYETGLFFSEHGGQPQWARRWSGDRLWQLQLDGKRALVWALAFENLATARHVEALLAQQPEFSVTRSAKQVIVMRGVPEPLAEQLLAALAG